MRNFCEWINRCVCLFVYEKKKYKKKYCVKIFEGNIFIEIFYFHRISCTKILLIEVIGCILNMFPWRLFNNGMILWKIVWKL